MRKKSNGKRRRQGKHTEYKRDLAGNLIEVVDALGNVDSYSYDSEGRILCKADREGNKTSYTYDGYGNRIQMRKGEEEYFYSYNSLNQLLAVEGSRKQSYFYDKRGNLISQYNEGEKILESTFGMTLFC